MAKKPVKNKLPVASTSKPVPVKIVSDSINAAPKESYESRKWRAQDALRDIQRVEGYKKDKQLMADVKKCAKEQMNALKSVVK